MKKQALLVAALSVFLLQSCEEKPPLIKFTEETAKDTTYVGAVPSPKGRQVLVEEYTGASCPNCPAGHEILKEYQKTYPGRINVIGLYITGPIQTKPPVSPHAAVYDFRHGDATSISKVIYGGVSSLPTAGIDRKPFDGNLKVDRGSWGAAIENGLALPDSLNLTVEGTFDSTSGKLTVVAKIEYPVTILFPHNLSLAVLQDSIIDVQEYPSTDPVHPGGDEKYLFTNVLRTMLTTVPGGDPIMPSLTVKEPGRVVIKAYTFDTKNITDRSEKADKWPAFKANHAKVVAFVTNEGGGSYRVIQSAQAAVKYK
jgi:thiol-disulfide isomerase/thioredoxin